MDSSQLVIRNPVYRIEPADPDQGRSA